MSPRPVSASPARARPLLRRGVLLLLLAAAVGAGAWFADEGRRDALRIAFENWVGDLQMRFGIGARRYPGAADVEVFKPPMALRVDAASSRALVPPAGAPPAPPVDPAPAPQAAPAPASATRTLPALQVAPARGQQNTDIPLQIQLRDTPDPVGLLVVIGGLPMDVTLSAGTRDDKGRWLLRADGLEGLSLRAASSGTLTLLMRVRPWLRASDPGGPEATLEVTVMPVPAAPAAEFAANNAAGEVPAPATPPSGAKPDPGELVDNGRRALRLGDVAAARLYFEAAAAQGDGAAMFELAASYDPVQLGERGPGGIEPEPVRAAEWYRKAERAGLAEAGAALTALAGWLAQHPALDEAQTNALRALLQPPQ